MVNKSNIGEVSIEEKGFKLTIKQKEEPVQNLIAAPLQQQSYAPQQPMANTAPSAPVSENPKQQEAAPATDN